MPGGDRASSAAGPRRASAAAASGRPGTPRTRPSAGSGTAPAASNSRALVDEHRGVAAVVEDHVRAAVRATSAPARCTTSTPRASRPSRRRPGRPAGPRACRSGRRRPRRRRGPGSRRCCRRPSGPRRRARSSVSISTAVWIVMCSEPMMRAPLSGCAAANSSRVFIRPGISCSARRISLRPNSASERSATLKSLVGQDGGGAHAACLLLWWTWWRLRRAAAGACPAPSAASRRRATSSGRRGLGLEPRLDRAAQRRSSRRRRSAKPTSPRPMSCSASSSRRVRRRWSSAGP